MSYQAGITSIFIDDKDESSDLLEETVDVPEYILRWQEEHRVSDEVIEQRIQSALKDASRLNALSYDEMTVDACLLREGKPSDMFVLNTFRTTVSYTASRMQSSLLSEISTPRSA